MKRDVNEKWRVFARLLVDGVSRAEAYRRAYGCEGLSNVAASKLASRLAKNDEVKRLVDELNGRLDRRVIAGKQERMEALSEVMRGCRVGGDVQGMVRCIDVLNKMDGAYEPERVEVRGQLGVGEIVAAIQAAGQRPRVR